MDLEYTVFPKRVSLALVECAAHEISALYLHIYFRFQVINFIFADAAPSVAYSWSSEFWAFLNSIM